MPNIKSAKKRVLVNKTKAARNKSAKSALKTAIKKANTAIETNAADKEELVKAACKKIDQAAAKGLIHKNNAAHKKSALALKLNKTNA
ncbi:MAG: 30S ribosomal protein S20 [Clostridia bacterium]|nr:30S ribosomal protein S20 [Clostridia bacterium]